LDGQADDAIDHTHWIKTDQGTRINFDALNISFFIYRCAVGKAA